MSLIIEWSGGGTGFILPAPGGWRPRYISIQPSELALNRPAGAGIEYPRTSYSRPNELCMNVKFSRDGRGLLVQLRIIDDSKEERVPPVPKVSSALWGGGQTVGPPHTPAPAPFNVLSYYGERPKYYPIPTAFGRELG